MGYGMLLQFNFQLSAYTSCDISATLVMAYLPLDTNIFTILFPYVIMWTFTFHASTLGLDILMRYVRCLEAFKSKYFNRQGLRTLDSEHNVFYVLRQNVNNAAGYFAPLLEMPRQNTNLLGYGDISLFSSATTL